MTLTLGDHLSRLRALLYDTSGIEPWGALCEALDQIPDGPGLDLALTYVEDHLARWPDDLRYVPGPWRRRLFTEPTPDPRWRIAKTLIGERLNLTTDQLRHALDSGALAWITQLDLGPNAFASLRRFWDDPETTPVEALALAQGRGLERLRWLRIDGCSLCDDFAEALAQKPTLHNLEHLDLSNNHLSGQALRALARSPHLTALRSLALGANQIGDEGLEALADSPLLGRLERLLLQSNQIGDAGLDALAGAPALSSVRELMLSGNLFSSAGLARLQASEHLWVDVGWM